MYIMLRVSCWIKKKKFLCYNYYTCTMYVTKTMLMVVRRITHKSKHTRDKWNMYTTCNWVWNKIRTICQIIVYRIVSGRRHIRALVDPIFPTLKLILHYSNRYIYIAMSYCKCNKQIIILSNFAVPLDENKQF